MRLVEIFLPLADNHGKRFHRGVFDEIEHELSERFGGVTIYSRSPASGIWKDSASEKVVDDLVVFEVMSAEVEHDWWRGYCRKLEEVFKQEKVVIRAFDIEVL